MKTSTRSKILVAVGVVALGCFGCRGYLNLTEDDSASSDEGRHGHRSGTPEAAGGPNVGGGDAADQCTEPVKDVPLRMLTNPELDTALGQLFPEADIDPVRVGPDTRVGPFMLNAREDITPSRISSLREMAESVTEDLLGSLDPIVECPDLEDPTETECAHASIERIATKAFRRPLEETERRELLELYDSGRSSEGHEEGMRRALQAIVQSPSFVYLHERTGAPGEAVGLDSFQVAQRMASMLSRSLPDSKLRSAAEAGELEDPDVRADHARRLLSDDAGMEALTSVVLQWSGVDRLSSSDVANKSDEPKALAAEMREETRRFVRDVLERGDGDWKDLFSARYSVINRRLADHYGVDLESGEELGDGWWRVRMPHRAGVLTQGGRLAKQPDPIHRGLSIRTTMMCGSVPPPEGVDTEAIETEKGESDRSKAQKRLDNESCSGCHQRMDPLGLPFEQFGPAGQYRETDQHGNDLQPNGAVTATNEIDGDVEGPRALADRLAGSATVRRCLAKNIFIWAFRRAPTSDDRCMVQKIASALESHDGDLREAFVTIVRQPAFTRHRNAREDP